MSKQISLPIGNKNGKKEMDSGYGCDAFLLSMRQLTYIQTRSGRFALVEGSQEERCCLCWSNSCLPTFGMEPLQPVEHYCQHPPHSRECGFPVEQHRQLHRPVSFLSLPAPLLWTRLAVSDKALKRCVWFSCRPGVPVPDVVRHGVSDSQIKSVAEKVTTILNKLLGGFLRHPGRILGARVFGEGRCTLNCI